MIGNNSFSFNEATVIEIFQHYFNTVLFTEGKAPHVKNVKSSNEYGGSMFLVSTDSTFDPSQGGSLVHRGTP